MVDFFLNGGHEPCQNDPSVSVQAASDSDDRIIRKLLEVSSPEQLGVLSQTKVKKNGEDNIVTPTYTGIEIIKIYKISQGQTRKAYKELLEKESRSSSKSKLSTAAPNQEATQMWRSQGNLSEREYLLLHGSDVYALRSIVCNGFHSPVKMGGFGKGLYFADQIEKSDQYTFDFVSPEGESGSEIWQMPQESDDGRWVLVVRVNMGRTVQVQREIPCTKDSAERKRHRIYHWADPVGGQKDEITWENKSGKPPGNFTGGPPYNNWDSIQVIATAQDQDFSRPWEKTCEYTGLSNTFPWRFNEYVAQNNAPRVVAEYLVHYKRT